MRQRRNGGSLKLLTAEDSKKQLVSQAKSGLSLAVLSVLIIVLSLVTLTSDVGFWVGVALLGCGITVFVLANRKLNKICRK